MDLPIRPPLTPMLALLGDHLPEGQYLYEPKWDGFRALVFRDGDDIVIQSRHHAVLNRYFPELAEGLKAQLPPRVVIDGEIVIAGEHGLDFDALLQRLHPSTRRVQAMADERPAEFVAFDILAEGQRDLRGKPLKKRRRLLLDLAGAGRGPLHVTPATLDRAQAAAWFEHFEGAGADGIVAKDLASLYTPGERTMLKVKHRRTADCVIGGYRLGRDGDGAASLLLGLYDRHGRLHFAGVASGFAAPLRQQIGDQLRPYRADATVDHPWLADDGPGLYRIPEGPDRWSADRNLAWEAVRPEHVVEVAYDHLQGDRFRHATRFVRWRPDRTAESCTYEQLEVAPPAELAEIFGRRWDRAA
jgi:ATP-dependent DNA ligase